MKLLIDMNLRSGWVTFLAQFGIDALHWSSLGKSDAADIEIVSFAKANDYVIFTSDLDFAAILAVSKGDKPSVVIIRAVDVRPEKIGEKVVFALRAAAADLEQGALLVIEPFRSRIRLLPLA
jgi:predicted nuclease of predicted toxin-antitoxin system